jgi:DnaK suppressor protein
VSKSTAKAAADSKTSPAAKAPADSKTSPAAKAPADSKTSPAAKAPAKSAPSKSAPGKSAPGKSAAAKPAPKPAPKSAPKSAPPAKPAAAAAPQAAAAPKKATATPAPAQVTTVVKTPPAAAVSPPKSPPKASSRGSSRAAAPVGAKDIPPADSPVPGARHGFAERFGPAAKTAHRQMPESAELPKTAPKDPKLINAWKTKAGRDLSEAELLAMPESEYMNDKQLDFFRARLEMQKAELLSSADETTEHLREDTSIVPDPVDRATIEEEHALELRTRDRERKLLKKIAQALARLDNGDYGFCDETGEPIGLQRLMARPTATLTLEAQQRREMKQKMFGD